MLKTFAALGLAAAFAGLAMPAFAADLDEVLARNKIIIGVQNDLPPYSAIGDSNEPIGYDIDVAKLLAERLGVELELVVLTGANRVPYLLSNRVDAVVATIGITPERREAIGFTRPYLVFQTVMLAPQSVEVSSADDIGAYRVGVTRGTMMDPLVTKAAPAGTNIMRFDDDATSAVALATGQVDMVPTGELIARAIADQNPSRNLEIKFVMASTFAGIGVSKDSPALRDRLNEVIAETLADGALPKLYETWLGSAMPELPASVDELP